MKFTITRQVPKSRDRLTFIASGNSVSEARRNADELAFAVASHRKLLGKKDPKPEKWALAATTAAGQK